MKNSIKRILTILCCLILWSSSANAAIRITGEQEYVFIHDLVDLVSDTAKFPVAEEILLDAAFKARLVTPEKGFNGMIEAVMDCLDEHSGYMTEETYRSFMENTISGKFSGIGINISIEGNTFVVLSPIKGSPAEKAGILGGDILVAVDDVNIENEEFQAVKQRITGEVGTTVKITVRRGKALLSFTVVRAIVETETVLYEVRDGIGYIELTTFNQSSAEKVKEATEYFQKEGIRDLIVDLRNNPGGEMQSALDICRLFTPKGVIMRVEYANSRKNELYYNEQNNRGKFNLVVLINGGSASASELFAAAVQDTASGTIIGTTSFGKGTVQTVLPIVTGGGIRLTVAEYKTAGGRALHKKGVVPDIVVENKKEIPDTSYMVPMEMSTTWQAGDTGTGVLALEQRLAFWGYMEEADEVADAKTTSAILLFQAHNNLPTTGTADIYTQLRLNDVSYEVPVEIDHQILAAMEFLKNEG